MSINSLLLLGYDSGIKGEGVYGGEYSLKLVVFALLLFLDERDRVCVS